MKYWVSLALFPFLLAFQYIGVMGVNDALFSVFYLAGFAGCLWLSRRRDATIPAWTPAARPLAARMVLGFGGLLWIAGTLAILNMRYGWVPVPPAPYKRILGEAVLMSLLGTMLSGWLAPMLGTAGFRPRSLVRVAAQVGSVFAAALVARLPQQGLPLFPPWILSEVVLWTAFIILLICVVRPPRSILRFVLLVVLLGVALRVVGLHTWEVHPLVRDMLALVQSAWDRFVAGQHPYGVHQMQEGSQVPLTYLPGMWMLYGLPRGLGLDIRWAAIAADICIAASMVWALRRVPEARRPWAEAGVALFCATWFFLPSVHWNGIFAEPHIWWACLALVLACVITESWWLAAVALGVAMCTRHFGILLCPFVFLAGARALGWRPALLRLSVTAGIVALWVAPFALTAPDEFWLGTLRWLRAYGPVHREWFDDKIGFAGIFYRSGLHPWLVFVQVASLLAVIVLALPRRLSRRWFVPLSGTAFILFIMFNGLIWHSFYLGASLFAGFALLDSGGTRAPHRPVPRSLAIGLGVVLLVSLCVGGLMLWDMARYADRSPLKAARSWIIPQLQTSDAVVDASGDHVSFIQDAHFLRGHRPGRRIIKALDVFHPSSPGLDAIGRDRFWVAGRSPSDLQSWRRLGKVVAEQGYGRFTVLGIQRHDIRTKLSQHLDVLHPFRQAPDQAPVLLAADVSPTAAVGHWKGGVARQQVVVQGRRCRLDRAVRPLVHVQAGGPTVVTLRWEKVQPGQSLVVLGGFVGRSVAWRRGDVAIDVDVGQARVGRLTLVNRPGLQWLALDTSNMPAGPARIRMTAHLRDPAPRQLCLDAWVLSPVQFAAP